MAASPKISPGCDPKKYDFLTIFRQEEAAERARSAADTDSRHDIPGVRSLNLQRSAAELRLPESF